MKKILFMCLIALGMIFTSCTVTKEYAYTSPIDYMYELKYLNDYYNNKGFYLKGESWNTENYMHINGYEYFISNFGNGHYGVTAATPTFENDYLYKNTYKFQDSIGNSVQFTLGYKIVQFSSLKKNSSKTIDDEIYREYYDEIVYSSVCDCETNNFNNYDDLCKNKEILKFNNNLNKKSTKTITEINKKTTSIIGECILGTLLISTPILLYLTLWK